MLPRIIKSFNNGNEEIEDIKHSRNHDSSNENIYSDSKVDKVMLNLEGVYSTTKLSEKASSSKKCVYFFGSI